VILRAGRVSSFDLRPQLGERSPRQPRHVDLRDADPSGDLGLAQAVEEGEPPVLGAALERVKFRTLEFELAKLNGDYATADVLFTELLATPVGDPPQGPSMTAVGFPDRLADLCHAAGVRLHHRLTDQEGPLDPAAVTACLKPGSSVWFCGPAGWGNALAQMLTGNGLPREAFHREVFEFR